jgi:tRNA-dihydrouridine synthase
MYFKRAKVKKIQKIFSVFTILLFTACGQGQIKTPNDAMDKFEIFKNKEKFVKDEKLHYPGIGNEKLKPILTEKINLVAEYFEKVTQLNNATDKDYQDAIKKGLQSFSEIYLDIDTENRERICSYFEELMDIVGLESSDGQLNNFMYGFDPTEK